MVVCLEELIGRGHSNLFINLFSVGWSPAPFVSSRSQKAAQIQQRPEDYMDEDVGVAGCVP